MRILSLLLVLLFSSQSFSQKVKPYKLEKTFWDKRKTNVRSVGYLNNNPYMSYFGTKEGEWLFYHKNGKLQEKSYFNRGKYVNESLQYYETGKLMIKGFFYLGEKDSAYTSFFENGRVAEEGNYKKGKKAGVWQYWYVDSTLRKISKYNSNEKEKVGSFWNKDKKQTIKNGNGSRITTFGSGKIKE
ncbi:hypothetical protein N9P38_01635, partial [Flavobacteriales bacterium]|nr:hypothetical protein [Flavobacteriales bacterium]